MKKSRKKNGGGRKWKRCVKGRDEGEKSSEKEGGKGKGERNGWRGEKKRKDGRERNEYKKDQFV